ncbi:MAG: protein O-mannosyl-transferase family [Candidatus Limnocylindrales bacterium]
MVESRVRLGAATSGVFGSAAARPLSAAVLVAVPALALYWRTLMPDVGFWDTAEFQAIGPVLGIAHPTGYPAYTLLAWLASLIFQPFGNEALRANLLSAVFVAAAVGVIAATVTSVTGRLTVGVATGIALAVSAETWAIGLRADPHALHLLLAAVVLHLLVRWQDKLQAGLPADRWLFAAAVVFGVSLGNHGLTLLLAPGIAIFVLVVEPGIVRRPRVILTCAAGLAFTIAAIYAYLPLRSAMNPPLDYANPETWDDFRYLVFAEQFRGTFRALPDLGDALRTIGQETFDQLGLFALLAVLGVLVTAWRRPALMLLLAAWFVVNWYFALGYINADIGRYYLVPLLAAAVFGGLAAGALLDWISDQWATRLRPAQSSPPSGDLHMQTPVEASATTEGQQARTNPLPRLALAAMVAALLITPSLVAVPARFRTVDASRDEIARTWLDTVLPKLPPDAVVVSWWSYSTTLWYALYVEHQRPDVTVIDDSTIVQERLGTAAEVIDSYLGLRPVYLIRLSYDLPQFEERYVLTPLSGVIGGPVYRVDGMRAVSAQVANL